MHAFDVTWIDVNVDDVCSLPKLRIIADRYGNVNVVVGVKGTEEWSIRCVDTQLCPWNVLQRRMEFLPVFATCRYLNIPP